MDELKKEELIKDEIKLLKKNRVSINTYCEEGYSKENIPFDNPILQALYFVEWVPRDRYKGPDILYYEGFFMYLGAEGNKRSVELSDVQRIFKLTDEELKEFERIKKKSVEARYDKL